MLGPAAGWLAVYWLRGAALLGSLLLTTGAAIWTATSVPSTGLVLDSTGRPVAGAVITVAATAFSPAGKVRTDAQGRYSVGARRWPYHAPRILVTAPEFLPAVTGGGNMVLRRWPQLNGQVVDDAGSSVAGAVITLSHDASVIRATMTNLDGRFEMVIPPAEAGADSVAATLDQHDPNSAEVTLGPDLAPFIMLTLARQFGTLHIESDPSGQVPQVDGEPAPDCQATPCDASVLVGGHDVRFTGEDFLPWRQDVQVGKGETASVQARLDRKTGTLTLAGPGPGELTVDGRLVGGSGWTGKLATGPHLVAFRSASNWPYLAQATVTWNQTTQMTLTPTPVTSGDAGAFSNNLRSYLDAQGGGSYGVYLEQLNTGSTIGVNETSRLEAASVIKVPEALYLLHQVDSGQVSLDDQLDLHPEDFMSGTGSLYTSANPGDRYSYQQLLSVLIQQSDNTAWRALRRVLGDSSIDAYAGSLGAGDCLQVTNSCSARSAGRLLAQLARGRLLGSSSTRLLLNLLETTIFNDRIPYYLAGTTIAHKVGMDPSNGVANDCGVVFQGSDPFVVCVFTTSANPDNGAQVIRDIARAAARLY